MKKVAIISAINTNYGTLLQAYATQQELEKLGLDTEIFYYTSNPIKQFYRVFNFPFLKTKIKAYNVKITTKLKYPEIYNNIKIREKVFMDFRLNKLTITNKIASKDELKRKVQEYDGVVLGSDQVWNPQNLEMDYYTLNFVPDNMPKITYAPSFGVSSIPTKQRKKTVAYLQRIQHISVRELAGSKIVKDLIGRDVPTVCDPTALLNRDQWDEIKTDKVFTTEKYIFCYFLGDNPQYREFANKVAKQTGFKILAIQHMDEFVKSDLTFADIRPYDVDPGDFVNLVANAEMVLTDSFHGTMFSIYYHIPFYTFNYDVQGSKNSVNSRIDSIMKLLQIEDRRFNGTEDVEESLQNKIEWESLQERLDNFRKKSERYLVDALVDSNLIEEQSNDKN